VKVAEGNRSLVIKVFLMLSCLYLFSLGGHFYSGDGIEMFRTTVSLVERGDLALVSEETGREWGYPGADGRRYSPYALGLSIVQAPFYGLATAAVAPLPLPDVAKRRLPRAATMTSAGFITAATACFVMLIAVGAGWSRRSAVGISLLYGVGSMAWVYAKHDFAEPLATLCLTGAAYYVLREARAGSPWLLVAAGALNGYAFFTKYQMVIYTPIFLACMVLPLAERTRNLAHLARRLTAFLLPALLFGLANLYINYLKFGDILDTGYGRQGEIFAGIGAIPGGLLGLLASPGKGLLWYSPIVVAVPFAWRRFHRHSPRESLLAAGMALFTLAMFSPLWWWHGDWAWGPRYLLVALPFILLPMSSLLEPGGWLSHSVAWRLRGRHLLVLLLAIGIGVNFLGLAVGFTPYLQALSGFDKYHDDWNYIPNLSPIRFHAHMVRGWMTGGLNGDGIPDFTYRAWRDGEFRDQVISPDTWSEGSRHLDSFFFRPRDTAAEQFVLGGAGFLFLAIALVLGLNLRRTLKAEMA
jgi:hypothetical protein